MQPQARSQKPQATSQKPKEPEARSQKPAKCQKPKASRQPNAKKIPIQYMFYIYETWNVCLVFGRLCTVTLSWGPRLVLSWAPTGGRHSPSLTETPTVEEPSSAWVLSLKIGGAIPARPLKLEFFAKSWVLPLFQSKKGPLGGVRKAYPPDFSNEAIVVPARRVGWSGIQSRVSDTCGSSKVVPVAPLMSSLDGQTMASTGRPNKRPKGYEMR